MAKKPKKKANNVPFELPPELQDWSREHERKLRRLKRENDQDFLEYPEDEPWYE